MYRTKHTPLTKRLSRVCIHWEMGNRHGRSHHVVEHVLNDSQIGPPQVNTTIILVKFIEV